MVDGGRTRIRSKDFPHRAITHKRSALFVAACLLLGAATLTISLNSRSLHLSWPTGQAKGATAQLPESDPEEGAADTSLASCRLLPPPAGGWSHGSADKGAQEEPEQLDEALKAPPPYSKSPADSEEDNSEDSDQESTFRPFPKHLNLSQILESHVAFPGSDTCGPWADSYKALHAAIRRGDAGMPRKYLTYEPVKLGPGLGDRMNGLVAAFLTALLTQRALIVADSRLQSAFETSEIDWHVRSDVPTHVTTESMYNVSEGCVLRIHAFNNLKNLWPLCPDCAGMVWDILPHFQGTQGASNIVLHAHLGILTRLFAHPRSDTYRALWRMGLRLPTAFACITRFILRPRRRVLRMAKRPLAALIGGGRTEALRVCVHVRTHDQLAFGKDPSASLVEQVEKGMCRVVQCAQGVEDYWVPASKRTKWFLMSDSEAVRRSILALRPRKVVTSGLKPCHTAEGGMTSSAVDWLLFSMCQYYVLVDSGFSKTSYAFNMNLPPFYMFSRLDWAGKMHSKCDPSKPQSLMDMANWSGL